jgi:hypothetical protein
VLVFGEELVEPDFRDVFGFVVAYEVGEALGGEGGGDVRSALLAGPHDGQSSFSNDTHPMKPPMVAAVEARMVQAQKARRRFRWAWARRAARSMRASRYSWDLRQVRQARLMPPFAFLRL